MLFSSYMGKKNPNRLFTKVENKKQANGYMYMKICTLNNGEEETIYKVKIGCHSLLLMLAKREHCKG